ncbi:hypothetical protein VTJ04DRAFT_5283 [Mycothermus thermophilus]|uniref:uncharacterized protein n=1 Tax=Humicola insolens TaxID=85995 RepID=UPI003743B49D
MKLLAALSLFVVASTALPVDTPAVGVGVPNATAVEVAEKRQANPFEEIYLLDCWNYGVRQSWVFYYTAQSSKTGYPPDNDRCLVTYGRDNQWGGHGSCKFPTGVTFTWDLVNNVGGLPDGMYAGTGSNWYKAWNCGRSGKDKFLKGTECNKQVVCYPASASSRGSM